jgi:hypothetical protein
MRGGQNRPRHQCGAGFEYLHRNPASHRRRRKGRCEIWDSKIWPRVPRDSDPRKTTLARASSGTPQNKTVTVKKGLDTKTYWLTERQSQCDFDFEYACNNRGIFGNGVYGGPSRGVTGKKTGATKSVVYESLWGKELVGRPGGAVQTGLEHVYLKNLHCRKAVARERLVKTQQAGRDLAFVVLICDLWRLAVALWLLVVPSLKYKLSIIQSTTPSIITHSKW